MSYLTGNEVSLLRDLGMGDTENGCTHEGSWETENHSSFIAAGVSKIKGYNIKPRMRSQKPNEELKVFTKVFPGSTRRRNIAVQRKRQQSLKRGPESRSVSIFISQRKPVKYQKAKHQSRQIKRIPSNSPIEKLPSMAPVHTHAFAPRL